MRAVAPVLEEIGTDQEQAAYTLGASRWQGFWRITLPAIRWALAYGVVLSLARALGEFGAVAVVSGNLEGQTQTLTLYVQEHFQNFDAVGAYSAAFLLALIAIVALVVISVAASQGEQLMAIRVRNVTKRFGDFVALDNVSVDIEDGELTALLGPSGGGKSTLLRIIAGLELPDIGHASRSTASTSRCCPPQRRNIGFVFQHYAAFKHLTVARNVAFGLEIRKRPKAEIKARVKELLELVHLEQFGDRYPSQLSGGQRQRMALARALAVQPEVLLLDEPFGALDAQVRKELRTWLRRLHDEVHVTTVFVTHDQEEAMDVADRIFVMAAGRVEQDGTPDELYERPANDFVMGFLGPVTKLHGELVRPHDLDLITTEEPGSVHARITRIARLGFEVRVEVEIDSDEGTTATWVQVTRERAARLGIQAGDDVFVRKADKERVSATVAPAAAGA